MHICGLMCTMMHGYALSYVLSQQPVSVLSFTAVSTCTTFYIMYFILWTTALIDFITSNILLLNDNSIFYIHLRDSDTEIM